jgi:hypothetical protein
MSRETAAAAIAELFGTLAPDGEIAVEGITLALDHDPGAGRIAEMAEPVLLTVSDAGLTGTHWIFAVRLVFDAEVDAAAAQLAARDIVTEVDTLLATHWGAGDWDISHSDDLPAPYARSAWVAQTRIEVRRADHRFRPGPAQ